jgi:hypothetical protein
MERVGLAKGQNQLGFGDSGAGQNESAKWSKGIWAYGQKLAKFKAQEKCQKQ